MNRIQVKQPTFLINLDNPTEVSYRPMEGNWKPIIVQTYQHGFPEIKDDEILYVFNEDKTSNIIKDDRGYILKPKQYKVMSNRQVIKVEVPKEIWDADMSIWNILFGRRDIMGAWMKSIVSVVNQIKQ